MSTALKGLDHDGLLNDLPPLPKHDTDPFEQAETSVQLFWPKSSVDDVLLAAKVVRKLGFVPEIRLVEDASGYSSIELHTKDVPSMARVLRESIEATKGRRP